MNKYNLPQRKHPRLKDYDYSTAGAYFVTICTQGRRCVLSRIVGRGLAPAGPELLPCGIIAKEELETLEARYPCLKIDRYVIMPNHIHAIFVLGADTAGASPRPTLSDMVCAYKSIVTRKCKKQMPIDKLFQNSFYEHIIRGREDYVEISGYIEENPLKWELDKFFPGSKKEPSE